MEWVRCRAALKLESKLRRGECHRLDQGECNENEEHVLPLQGR